MATLARYLRLYRSFVAFSFMRGFEFRFDFVARIAMDLLYYAVTIAFFRLLFLHTPGLGGWNEDQTLIFATGYCLIDAITMMVFADNLWMLSMQVNKGDLDFHLVRPVSTLFMVSVRHFSASSFMNFVFALCLVGWSIGRYPEHLSAGAIATFVLLVANGSLLFYFITASITLSVFWTHATSGLIESAWSISKVAERPDRIYRGWFRRIVTTALPYALMVSFPTRLLIDGWSWEVFLHIVVVDVAFFFVLLGIWRAGLRAYSSASS